MGDVLAFLAVGTAFAAVLLGLARLAPRLRRSGMGGALAGPADEIFHPAAHRSHIEIQVRDERLAPRPSADDRPTTRSPTS